MKSHRLWIIFLIIYMKCSSVTLAYDYDCEAENCDYSGPDNTECICEEDCGKIKSPIELQKDVVFHYTLTGDFVVLRIDDFSGLSTGRCYIEFPDGRKLGSSGSNKPTRYEKYLYTSFIFTASKDCSWEFTYAKYPLEIKTNNITYINCEINDTIKDDPYSIFNKRPNTHAHYIIQSPGTGYAINVDVSYQKLGVPFYEINDQINEETTGDMVLVGSGPNVLSGDETVLFGSLSKTTKMRIDADVAHVSISYNSLKEDSGLNFNCSFIRKEETTTVPTTVITTPMPPSEKYYAWVAINFIAKDQAESLKPEVKMILADIATVYSEDENLNLDHNITADDVAIYKVTKCNEAYCSSDCVAYRYSILYVNEDGEWVFDKNMMNEMVRDNDEKFKDLTPNRDFEDQVCNENPKVSIVPYISVSVVVVLIGCIVSFIVYKAGLGSAVKEKREKYKKENQERNEDERRRSSGNISMLGIGHTRGSVTSMSSSRKFSMPFTKKGTKPKSNVKYDVSGFKEFNPENSFGGEPVVLGLEKEFLGNPSTMKTYYTNEGYTPDEGTGSSKHRQLHWEAQEGSSSGSSSDAEDDVPSVPPPSQSHELARRQLQERLATIQASDSEEENDSDQDVLFNRNPGNSVQLKSSMVVPVDVHPYLEHEGETIL